MNFYIQASNPKTINNFDDGATTLDEYIESVFNVNTEYAIIYWSGTFIPLNYKYTVSSIMHDLIYMLNKLIKLNKGNMIINWSSSDFLSSWELSWNGGNLEIITNWESVIGNTENKLNRNPNLLIKVNDFLKEWKKLIEIVYTALINSGYNKDILELKTLKYFLGSVKEYGVLYK